MADQASASGYPASVTVAAASLGSTPTAVAENLPVPGTRLGIPSIPNLRDIGGYATKDGSVVQRGVAYRSNQLNPIAPDDMKKLAALGLKNDFDLRSAQERDAKPDQLPTGVKDVWLNVLADAKDTNPAEVEEMLHNPKGANTALGDGKGAAKFMDAYREFVTLPSAKTAFRQLFIGMGEMDQLPCLFHCTTGKDRSGWAAAALLTLLGVPEEKVYEDYLRSNEYILPAYKQAIDGFVAEGGDPSIPQDLLGVKTEYLQAAFDEVKTQYGGIEGYFEKALGIDKAGQQQLRNRFLTVAQK